VSVSPSIHKTDIRALFIRTTTPDPSVLGLEDSDKQLLPLFVQTAHQNVCYCPSFAFPDSHYISMSLLCCQLEAGLTLDPFLLP